MSQIVEHIAFDTYISSFRDHLKVLFREEYDYNKISINRDFPSDFLKKIMDKRPLDVAIPTAYGGRGVDVKECLSVLAAASYESLALSLTFGINIALFLEPLAKYGSSALKERVFPRFVEDRAMGGLMITEKMYGSDALNLKTCYHETENGYQVKGEKHWQGLSGAADFWIVTARKTTSNGELARDIDFFVTDNKNPEQHIPMVERYNNLGLYAIPYGVNPIDISVGNDQKLLTESTGIKLLLDMLHRSRLQFPGMGMGFIKRLLDETIYHCEHRIVCGIPLSHLDNVKFQISRIQAAYTLCSAMCAYSVKQSGIEHDLFSLSVEANSLKALVTDLMQESAQISLQLAGAMGYRLDHIAGRAVVDSRPFQIFEGSNEMLYGQIADAVIKSMRKAKESNLLAYLKIYPRTAKSITYFEEAFNFSLESTIKQRDIVILGSMLARLICFQMVLEMEGYNPDLVEITRQHMHRDLTMSNGHFISNHTANAIFTYEENSDWANFIR